MSQGVPFRYTCMQTAGVIGVCNMLAACLYALRVKIILLTVALSSSICQ